MPENQTLALSALSNLYAVTRLAMLTADQHDELKRCADIVRAALEPRKAEESAHEEGD